jgi:AcrR family transcriptional regulator
MAKPREDRLKIREEVAALKRQRTLDAATDLFYDKGYTNTTLDDVAEVLGVTKPFIYANFGSKSALLTEICSLGVHGALEQIEYVLAQDLPPAEGLRLFVPRYVTAILRRQKSIAINIREEKNLEPADAERLADAGGTLTLLPGVNHVLKTSPEDRAGNLATYGNPDLPLADTVIPSIVDFIEN